MKSCANCCWYDQCAGEIICEHYDPLDSFELTAEEYEIDLKLSVEAYYGILDKLEVNHLEEMIKEIENGQELIDQRRDEVEESI